MTRQQTKQSIRLRCRTDIIGDYYSKVARKPHKPDKGFDKRTTYVNTVTTARGLRMVNGSAGFDFMGKPIVKHSTRKYSFVAYQSR